MGQALAYIFAHLLFHLIFIYLKPRKILSWLFSEESEAQRDLGSLANALRENMSNLKLTPKYNSKPLVFLLHDAST